jgi:hypothetical protein
MYLYVVGLESQCTSKAALQDAKVEDVGEIAPVLKRPTNPIVPISRTSSACDMKTGTVEFITTGDGPKRFSRSLLCENSLQPTLRLTRPGTTICIDPKTRAIAIDSASQCAFFVLGQALPGIQRHIQAKYVPSNLFTFAPQAYAEEKGVSGR